MKRSDIGCSMTEKQKMREERLKQSRDRGTFLYQLRRKTGMTLGEAAGQIGINKSTLCRYEQGLILSVSESVRHDLCRVYRITDRELEEGRILRQIRETATDPEEEKRRKVASHLLDEEDFLQLYRKLDDCSKLRIQFMAGAFRES